MQPSSKLVRTPAEIVAAAGKYPSNTKSERKIWTEIVETGLVEIKQRADAIKNGCEFIQLLRDRKLTNANIANLQTAGIRFDPEYITANAFELWSTYPNLSYPIIESAFDVLTHNGLASELTKPIAGKPIWLTCGNQQLVVIWNKRQTSGMPLAVADQYSFLSQVLSVNCKDAVGGRPQSCIDSWSLAAEILRDADGDFLEAACLGNLQPIIVAADVDLLEPIVRRSPYFRFFADPVAARRIDYRSWTTAADRFRCDRLIDFGCRLFAMFYDVLVPAEITASGSNLLPSLSAIVAGFCRPLPL